MGSLKTVRIHLTDGTSEPFVTGQKIEDIWEVVSSTPWIEIYGLEMNDRRIMRVGKDGERVSKIVVTPYEMRAEHTFAVRAKEKEIA